MGSAQRLADTLSPAGLPPPPPPTRCRLKGLENKGIWKGLEGVSVWVPGGCSRKGRSKREAAGNTNRPNPAGHERKIALKLQRSEPMKQRWQG
uniref:Uncharacterized protein n=1 Tax=Chelydra serpentina TaxID=8475 RepID=A0A8C3SFK6_CHESE